MCSMYFQKVDRSMRGGDDTCMTTKLLELLYSSGLSDKDILMLKNDREFRIFLDTFSDAEKLAYLVHMFATTNPSVGVSLARSLHAHTMGHPKDYRELGIPDSQLTFSYSVLHALATSHNADLVKQIHGLASKRVSHLDAALTSSFHVFTSVAWADKYKKRLVSKRHR